NGQRMMLAQLLSDQRISRMAELEAEYGDEMELYSVSLMLRDVRRGVWSELDSSQPDIDLYRRNLQRAWVQTLHDRLHSETISGETRALMRGNLRLIQSQMEQRVGNTADAETRMHLEDMLDEVNALLDV
ncbi:MAG: zinc-dependent metalloprotease, partial [Cyclonatronaceae bacterium]